MLNGLPEIFMRHIMIHILFFILSELYLNNVTTVPSQTHWGRMTYMCVSKLAIIESENVFSPCRHQDIIWTNTGILLIGLKKFSENESEICTFSLKKLRFKMSSGNITVTLKLARWRSNRPDYLLNRLLRRRSKKIIKAIRQWPLWGESTGDRWIAFASGQWRGECFHLMTSSWNGGHFISASMC